MGVKGLTTYMQKNSNLYMEKLELHDMKLVLDGIAVAYQLYREHLKPTNCCFTGDYDRFGNVVKNFFLTLQDCNIDPYIVLDGGYEKRKMDTITLRLNDRLKIAERISVNSDEVSVPLMIGETFKDIAMEFNIKIIRCDYEADKQVAHIAKQLGCPVLSNDSDFFIFDVSYIPLTTFSINSKEGSKKNKPNNTTQITYKYIPCQIFNSHKFLKVTGLQKELLPVFATLLGNDFIDTAVFRRLFQRFNSADRISSLIKFLYRETKYSAIQKVLKICNYSDKDKIFKIINETINGYVIEKENNPYLQYFELGSKVSFASDDVVETYASEYGVSLNVLHLFLGLYRKSLYPACFISFLLEDTYYINSQIEDFTQGSAHLISTEIIAAIHKILKNSNRQIRFFTRKHRTVQEFLISPCKVNFENFQEIQNISLERRKKILFTVISVDESFERKCVEQFPECWKLYILTIQYLYARSILTWPLISALVLCKIVTSHVDKGLRIFTRSPNFKVEHKQEICNILLSKTQKREDPPAMPDSITASTDISYEDAVIGMKNLSPFFQKNVFHVLDRTVTHTLAQFQSCFMHLKFLNDLLNSPFPNVNMADSFNGTFIYNFVRERGNRKDFVDFLLENANDVLNCYHLMMNNLRINLKTMGRS